MILKMNKFDFITLNSRNMKKVTIYSILIFLLYTSLLNAQVSGNEVYNQSYSSSYDKVLSFDKLYLTDSTFIVKANILNNVIADNYVAVFGLAEESNTLEDCNNKIEKRIAAFILRLRKLGINAEDVYTDLTTQNKIYDYKITDKVAEEYLQGFEIKKNVIIRFKKIKDLEEICIVATDFQIYDLVKVDYLVDDINKIYTQMFHEAVQLINQKKDLYVGATNIKLYPGSQIYGESFYHYTPNQLYKSYNAYESGRVSGYNKSYTVKDIRKSQTYYYNKINYSGFDKVINPSVTEPPIEFILSLAIKYEIKNTK